MIYRRIIIGAAAASVIAAGGAFSSVGATGYDGIWTAITSQGGAGGSIFLNIQEPGSPPTIPTLKGVASPLLEGKTLDLACTDDNDSTVLGSNIQAKVHNGRFSLPLNFSDAIPPCTLRAIPDDDFSQIDTSDNEYYIGSFTGPHLYIGLASKDTTATGEVTGYHGIFTQPGAIALFSDVSEGGINGFVPFDPVTNYFPSFEDSQAFLVGLPPVNADTNPTASTIQIDGKNAYLPNEIKTLQSANEPPPASSVTIKRGSDGSLSLTETDAVERCKEAQYPPPSPCTVQSTGVQFSRTLFTTAQGATVYILDRFTGTDSHAHTVRASYINLLPAHPNGTPGIALPPATAYREISLGVHTATLRRGPATIHYTSDLHGVNNSTHQVLDLTYSGKPSYRERLDERPFVVLGYSRSIKAHGTARFSQALSTTFTAGALKPLTKAAEAALRPALTIVHPATSASVKHASITVSGNVSDVANGQPATVKLSDGSHHATATVSKSGHWSATLHIPTGSSHIHARAVDPAGNVLTDSVKIKRT